MKHFSILFSIAIPFSLAGCATIVSGTTESISITSQPSGANVFIDGSTHGRTPTSVELKRRKGHSVRVEMDGYEAFERAITTKANGWIWGNIIFGGIPGLIVDLATGAIHDLEPNHIVANLTPNKTNSSMTGSQD